MRYEKHKFKKWEITLIELSNGVKKYKVTRIIPEMNVAETKFFNDIGKAKDQFEEWLK